MIRAHVTDHLFGTGVRIAVIAHEDSGSRQRIMHLRPDGLVSWDEIDEYAETAPTIVLGDAEGRAVLEALTRYYHGAEDTRALRRDYDAERARVDLLIGEVCGLARSPAGGRRP